MDELIEFLEENDIEVTDDLREQISNIWNNNMPDTDDLFTQEDVNEIIQKRLAREQKLHEQEIQELKEEMEDLVDPAKVEEYEERVEELEGKAEERETELKQEYELKLAATEAGVSDQEYFEFLAEKRGLKDRLTVNDDGEVIALNEDGDPLEDDDGNKLGPEGLIKELEEDKPDLFGEEGSKEKKNSSGPTNPANGPDLTEEEKQKQAENLAAELGYKTKDKE